MRFRAYAYDWVAWILFASVPVIVFWQCSTSLVEQDAAGGGPMENAALYPRVLAGVMSVLVVVQALRLLLGKVRQPSPFKAHPETRRALVGAGLFVVYLVALPVIGFHIATPLLCTGLFLLLGMSIVASVVGAVLLWLATSFVFAGLLNVVLPVGVYNISLFN
jgi:hypothetical protein